MNMPVYLQPAATASPSSTQGTMPVKPETAQLMMMMDQSMADASGQDVHMDASDFLFYDDEDLSSSDDDSDDDDSDDDDEDGSDSDDSDVSLEHDPETDQKIAEEIRVSMNNMRTGLQRVRSANSLKSMMNGSSNGSKSLRRGRTGTGNEGMPTMILTGGIATPRDPRRRLQASNSMANLAQLKLAAEKAQAAEKKSMMKQSISAGNFTTIRQSAQQEEIDESIPKPDDHLASLIGGPGERFAYNGAALEGFFLPVKPEYVAAWTNELTRAIRDHDLATVQQLHRQGHRLQACNQFGETSIHLAVRRGSPAIVRYLLQDASVSMRVCCDYGRTPLHDAAWSLSSCTGAFEKMEILLQESPMQLYITDKRGFTPLDYVPRNRWKECNQFLDRQYAKGRLFRIGK